VRHTTELLPTKEEDEPSYTGWLATSELKAVKQIVNDEEQHDDEKRKKLHDVLLEMQETHLAQAVNIGMHMALWTPKSKEKASSGGGQDVVPFANF
jgi:hypothetical protein